MKLNTLDLNLNFYESKLKVFCSDQRLSVDMNNQSPNSFANEVEKVLQNLGIEYKLPDDKFTSEDINYNKEIVIELLGHLKTSVFYFSIISEHLIKRNK
jgi:hypothetical protein